MSDWRLGDAVVVSYMGAERRGVVSEVKPPKNGRQVRRWVWVVLDGPEPQPRLGYEVGELTRA